jgi:hypothetical protein
MKKFVKVFSLGLFVFGIFYLLGVFIEVSFNILNWKENTRILVSSLGGTISVFAMVFCFFVIDSDERDS